MPKHALATRLHLAQLRSDIERDRKRDLERLHREIVTELTARFDELLDRMNGQFDERFDQMNGQFSERLDRMGGRFDQLNASVNQRFDSINERFDRMHEQMRVMMRWTVGAIVAIGAIISVLLSIAEFA